MLLSRNIIIDTQFFVSNKFDFSRPEFQSLKTLVEKGLITVYITEINKREVRKKIADQALSTFEKLASRDIAFLSIVPELKKLSTYSKEDFIQLHETEFEKFCSYCRVKIIPVAAVDIMSIFEDYCLENPPFNQKKDKKSEFPDALALASITAWSKSTRKKAYILSNDGDWVSFFEAYQLSKGGNHVFDCVNYLKKFTSKIYHAEKKLQFLIEFTDSVVEYRKEEISSLLMKQVENAGYLCQSFDSEADITHLHIINATIKEKDLLSVRDEFAVYAIDFIVTGLFEFEVTSYESAFWDSEDGVSRGEEYSTVLKKISFEVSAEVEISFGDRNKENAEVEGLTIPKNLVIDYDEEEGEEITQEEWERLERSE